MDNPKKTLSEEDKKFIVDNYAKMSPYQMAVRRNIFCDKGKCEAITNFIKESRLKGDETFVAPTQPQESEIVQIAKQVEASQAKLEERQAHEAEITKANIITEPVPAKPKVVFVDGLYDEDEKFSLLSFVKTLQDLNITIRSPPSEIEKRNMLFVMNQMESTRFILTIKTFRLGTYKKLFREEFIRSVYPLGEMPQVEINDFIDICNEMVMQYDNRCKIRDLEKIREDKLSEKTNREMIASAIISIDNTIIQLNDKHALSTKRVGEIKKSLGANREQRMKDARPTGLTMIGIIEAFQDQEKRESLMKLQQKKDTEFKTVYKKLDDFDSTKAYILGVSEDELLQGAL